MYIKTPLLLSAHVSQLEVAQSFEARARVAQSCLVGMFVRSFELAFGNDVCVSADRLNGICDTGCGGFVKPFERFIGFVSSSGVKRACLVPLSFFLGLGNYCVSFLLLRKPLTFSVVRIDLLSSCGNVLIEFLQGCVRSEFRNLLVRKYSGKAANEYAYGRFNDLFHVFSLTSSARVLA